MDRLRKRQGHILISSLCNYAVQVSVTTGIHTVVTKKGSTTTSFFLLFTLHSFALTTFLCHTQTCKQCGLVFHNFGLHFKFVFCTVCVYSKKTLSFVILKCHLSPLSVILARVRRIALCMSSYSFISLCVIAYNYIEMCFSHRVKLTLCHAVVLSDINQHIFSLLPQC